MWEWVFQERLSGEEAEKVKHQTLGVLFCLPNLVCVREAIKPELCLLCLQTVVGTKREESTSLVKSENLTRVPDGPQGSINSHKANLMVCMHSVGIVKKKKKKKDRILVSFSSWVALHVESLCQQHQPHLATNWKCRLSGSPQP